MSNIDENTYNEASQFSRKSISILKKSGSHINTFS